MLQTLRNRLILSHILPSLVVIPVMGLVLIFVLENRLLLPAVYENLATDARLMAEITDTRPEYWSNPVFALPLVQGANEFLSGQVDMLRLDGSILASGRAGSAVLENQIVELPNLSGMNKGDVLQLQRGPLAEVFTLVINDSGQILGIIRMTTRVVTVTEEIYRFRYIIGGMMLVGVIAGALLGSYLAVGISRPIQGITHSIANLADGNWELYLQETGFTETRVLARTINALIERIHSLEQARRQLLANLVHELGRPLGAFRSAIQALLKGAMQEPQLSQELLEGMDGETKRLQRLLDDLAQLHDQVLGPLELHRVKIDLSTWLPRVIAPWEAAALQKEQIWEVSLPSNLPPVFADPDRVAQVISNLLGNAIKFTLPKGTISISVYAAEGRCWFQVQDSGPGIPAEEQKLIFDPFYRGSQGRRIVQGMGLGLSIASNIIQAHGGDIQVESTPGTGSRFTFWLDTFPQAEKRFPTI